MKVFWSWQNDYAPKTCRHFIRAALVEATQIAGEELGLEDAERPEVDHDTKNTPGMAEIPATILKKISESAVFVADVTPIGKSPDGKALPNPNVMIELGWAMSEVGPDKIIGVLNTASGWKQDDLPFDIRHRRILSYTLPEKADKKVRQAANKELVKDLAGALRVNLGQAVEDQTASTEIKGVPAKTDDPSIWASASTALEHHDSFGHNHKTTIAMPQCARGYIRVIPAGWKTEPPSVNSISKLPNGTAVWPQAEGTSSGDFGVCEHGFVRYWHTGNNETRNVAMYFDETGEFWVLHGMAVNDGPKGPALHVQSLVQGWAKTLKNSLGVMKHFGSSPVIKVEAGLSGVRDVRWPGQFEYQATPSRKDRCAAERQSRDWDEAAQLEFLTEAYNRVRDLFGFPKATADEVRKLIGS